MAAHRSIAICGLCSRLNAYDLYVRYSTTEMNGSDVGINDLFIDLLACLIGGEFIDSLTAYISVAIQSHCPVIPCIFIDKFANALFYFLLIFLIQKLVFKKRKLSYLAHA